MINAIDVGKIKDTNYINDNNKPLLTLNNISKINIFVGENNSGKSRLLRSLFKNDDVFVFSNKFIDDSKKNKIEELFKTLNNYVHSFNENNKSYKINIPKEYTNEAVLNRYLKTNEYIRNLNLNPTNYNAKMQLGNINTTLVSIKDLLLIPNDNRSIQAKKFNSLNLTYIPILRGIECFNTYYDKRDNAIIDTISMTAEQRKALEQYKNNAKKIYYNKISKAYEIKNEKHIFTAENLYDEITNKLLGEESGRKFIKDFQDLISEEFYDGEEFSMIPQLEKGYLSVKIGNEADKALHNLGDGIKQLITLFYKIYEKKDDEAIFLIEEPEINLHPGYQRKFIEILLSKRFKKHQYFITTHSNHLIDSSFDYNSISIYKFINVDNKNNTFKVINSSSVISSSVLFLIITFLQFVVLIT